MNKLYHNLVRNAPYAFFIIALISISLGIFGARGGLAIFLVALILYFAIPFGIAALFYRVDIWLEKSK